MHIRPRALTMPAKIQQVLINLANTREMNRNINSVHQFLWYSSPNAIYLAETQISPSPGTINLQLPKYTLQSSFVPKVGVFCWCSSFSCRLLSNKS